MLSGELKTFHDYFPGFWSCTVALGKALTPFVVAVHCVEHEEAFDILYCIAFEMMDAQWLAMRASYMQFNVLIICSVFS